MTQDASIPQMTVDDLYAEEVRRAKEMSIGQRFFAGLELFELACEVSRAGIRRENPGASEQRVSEILRLRLELGRRLENGT